MKKPPLSPQLAESLRKAINVEFELKSPINLTSHSFVQSPIIDQDILESFSNDWDRINTQRNLDLLDRSWSNDFEEFILTNLSEKFKALGYTFESKYALEKFTLDNVHCVVESPSKTRHFFLKNHKYDYLPLLSITGTQFDMGSLDKGDKQVSIKATSTFKIYHHNESN